MSLKKLRQKYPEYKDIPDLKLAEAFYKKHYSDLDESDYFKRMFPEIAAERAEDVYTDFAFPDDEFGGAFESETTFRPTTSDIAKQANVAINDPASSKARFGASLGYNQEQKALAIKNVLSKQFDRDIDVRVGPNTGKLEYFNPRTDQYALVDAPGFDMGDFADLGGDALVIIPDIAASVVGTVYSGGNLPAGITAGALAAGVGEYARLKLGQKLYDINQDLTDAQLFNEAFKTAGISAGAGFLGLGAGKLIKSANNVIKGRLFKSVGEGLELAKSGRVLEADNVAKQINQRLDDAGTQSRLKFTLAEAADDKDLLAVQSSFENVRRLGKTAEFQEFGEKQAGALNEYFKLLKQEFGNTTGSAYDTGVVIKEVLDRRNNDIVKNIVNKQKASEDLLTKKIFKLPDGSEKVTGAQFRSIIEDLSKSYKSQANLAAKELDNAAGLRTINTDIIAKKINELTDADRRIFIKTVGTEGILKPDMIQELTNPKGFIPLKNARETISALGNKIRNQELGLAAGESVDVGRLKALKGAITEQVKKDAGSAYLDELQKFNDLVRSNKELLNNDIISKLTSIDVGNVLKIADEDIFLTTFKKGVGNGKAAREVFEVINKSPEALNAYKNSIFDFYKTKVFEKGRPNLTRHNAFIRDYEKPLKVFFNEVEFNKIKRIGGLQANIEKTNKLFTNVQKQLDRSFEGKLLNASPQEIFNKIYKPGNVGEVKTLKNILVKNPDVYKKFQRDVLSDLNERIFKRSDKLSVDRVLDAPAFDRYLNGGGGERGYKTILKEVFGDKYVKDLELLNRAVQISSRAAPTAQQGVVGSALTDLIRARLGQFTLAGRLFTAGRRIFQAASNRVIANALLNPAALSDLVRLSTMKMSSKAAAVILAKLGGSVFILPDDGTPVPSRTQNDTEMERKDVTQLRGLFNRNEPRIDLSMIPQSNVQTTNIPSINPNLFAQAPTGIMQNLTSTERALLSPEEQIIASRT